MVLRVVWSKMLWLQCMVLMVDAMGLEWGGGRFRVLLAPGDMWPWLFEDNDAGSCGKYLPLEKQSAIIRWFILFSIKHEDIDGGLRLIFNSGDMSMVLSSENMFSDCEDMDLLRFGRWVWGGGGVSLSGLA